MSFYHKISKEKKSSLQTYLYDTNHIKPPRDSIIDKRMSLFTSFRKGSITVEAAIAVPIFLFVVIQLLYSMDIIRLYSNMEMAMHQTGKQMAVYAYAYDKVAAQDSKVCAITGTIAFDEIYLKNKIIKEMDPVYLDHSPMVNGKNGISFLKTSYMEEDMIDLVAEYKVQPAVSLMGFSRIPLMNRCRVRAWTGYDNTKGSDTGREEDFYVYVTETGTVYHTDHECTHLNLTIETSSVQEVRNLRNESGGKYKICERCGNDNDSDKIFITKQGDRYHRSVTCSGLKRTIYTILISEAGGRRLCERCGKGRGI